METNRIYTAYSVLQKYLKDNNYTITYFSLIKQSPDRVIIWVDDNDNNITHFTCIKLSCTEFIIYGYGENYQQLISTGFDFADYNTPYLFSGDVPYYGGKNEED